MCELIPRYIVEFPNIKDILEGVVKEVKLTTRRFEWKRSLSNVNKRATKKQKVIKSKTTTPVHKKPYQKVKPKSYFQKRKKTNHIYQETA